MHGESGMTSETERRKLDHIRICLKKDVEARGVTAGFDQVHLIHRALPRVDYEVVDLSTKVFGHVFSAPVVVTAITGGVGDSVRINEALAEAVEELGLGMGVGSQRAAIENPRLERTFRVVREKAPTAFLIANIGYSQLTSGYGIREVERAVEMIEADAIAIHLNPLQEVIQREGRPGGPDALQRIGEVAEALDVPVIVKETGCGIAAEEARALEEVGVEGVDVAGVGGTSWAAVEHHRALEAGDWRRAELGRQFWDWGIPTVVSLVEVAEATNLTVIASGGVRTGLDAAKSIALGAHLAGLALPMLRAASAGVEEVKRALRLVVDGLRVAMFLSGARDVQELRRAPVVLLGWVAEWLRARGIQPERYARRGFKGRNAHKP